MEETQDNAAVSKKLKIADLLPDARNANKGTERGAQMIGESLRKFGAGRSILLDKHGRIIAGNKTAENATAAGLADVIVVQTDGTRLVAVQRTDLDLEADSKAQELAIADNRAGQVSLEWDADVLKELAEAGEVDLAQFWTDEELEQILGTEVPAELIGDEDAVPDAPEEPVTRPGDLYVLDNHRLLCGDSTNVTDVERLMDGEMADMVWTDPPYNVALQIEDAEEAKRRKRRTHGKGVLNDEMDAASFRQFLTDAFNSAFIGAKAGATIYVAHADSEGYNFRGALADAGWLYKQCLIWNKSSLVMGRQDYQWKHEPILYGWKPGAGHNWYSDRKQTTVLEFDRPSRSAEHPTMKPVALVEYCIGNSSKAKDRVLDLFGGSGTTLIACEKTGRHARLMELDPRYCDVICQRYLDATGKKAELIRA